MPLWSLPRFPLHVHSNDRGGRGVLRRAGLSQNDASNHSPPSYCPAYAVVSTWNSGSCAGRALLRFGLNLPGNGPGHDATPRCLRAARGLASRRTVKRDRAYFVLMGGCIVAVILAWTVVRLYSVTAAIVISVCVGLVPPIAAIVANAGDEGFRRR